MGPYDNESGTYLASDEWMEAQWLQDDDGNLYIIPIDGDQVEGPDGDEAEAILALLVKDRTESLTEAQVESLGMTVVSPTLKRFSQDVGYYVA